MLSKRTSGPVVEDDFINSGTAERPETTLLGFTARANVLVKASPTTRVEIDPLARKWWLRGAVAPLSNGLAVVLKPPLNNCSAIAKNRQLLFLTDPAHRCGSN
ncbi:MAG: hypothetical protein JNJ83_05815 [Verrucomicrobiaceae bacterium]|nr:hypothetical protein [Verrucomicrobiaceae bacterium]